MEPGDLSSAQHRPALGELLVVNGRQKGARRSLDEPAMFIGRAPGCEVRLNVDEVDLFHCAIACGADQVTVRDLNSGRGTFVNGQRISVALLCDGDLLDVGPFRFRVLLPQVSAPAAQEIPVDRDALRIQAAAVAAQQAALDDEELRLAQRRMTLDQQEAQLAAHLDEQRRQVLEAARQQAAERSTWEREKADAQRQLAERAAGVEWERQGVRDQWQRLAARAATLEQVKVGLQYQQGDLVVRQVRFNTERELDSRLLREGLQGLEREQRRWRHRRAREMTALRVRRLQLLEGERKLAEARVVLLREKQAWEAQRHILESELHGLNARVVHQRRKLCQQQQALEAVEQPRQQPEMPPAPTAASARVGELERLAGALADQRLQLLEQWQRLSEAQRAWQQHRDEAAGDLEALTQRLARQEEALARRAQDADAAESRLQQWQQQLEGIRAEAAVTQARLQSQQQVWEAEREHIRTEARALGELAKRQLDALGEVRRKWNRRRQQETRALRTERRAVEQLRHELAGAQMLVRQEGQFEEVELASSIQRELAVQDRRQRELSQQADELARARAQLQEQQTDLEHRETLLAAKQAQLDHEQQHADGRHQHAQRQLTLLQEESEHLARALLLPEPQPPGESLERAA